MPYYHCHDCFKVVHLDDEKKESCPLCGSKNGEYLTDEVHHKEVEEGYLFHEDTD
jgi:rRNA maturation endonuclease Nob1